MTRYVLREGTRYIAGHDWDGTWYSRQPMSGILYDTLEEARKANRGYQIVEITIKEFHCSHPQVRVHKARSGRMIATCEICGVKSNPNVLEEVAREYLKNHPVILPEFMSMREVS